MLALVLLELEADSQTPARCAIKTHRPRALGGFIIAAPPSDILSTVRAKKASYSSRYLQMAGRRTAPASPSPAAPGIRRSSSSAARRARPGPSGRTSPSTTGHSSRRRSRSVEKRGLQVRRRRNAPPWETIDFSGPRRLPHPPWRTATSRPRRRGRRRTVLRLLSPGAMEERIEQMMKEEAARKAPARTRRRWLSRTGATILTTSGAPTCT